MRKLYFGWFLCLLSFYLCAQENNTADHFRFWERHNSKWYVGLAGFVNDSLTGSSQAVSTARVGNIGATNYFTYETHAPAGGVQGIFGYMVNEIISFEVKYGQTIWHNKFYVRQIDTPDDPLFLNAQLNYKLGQINFGPATLIAFPTSKYFSPYFKGGFNVYRYHRDKSYDKKYSQPTTAATHSTYWDFRFLMGYGVRSQITDSFGMRLEYECALNPTVDTMGKLIQGNVNLMAFYTF